MFEPPKFGRFFGALEISRIGGEIMAKDIPRFSVNRNNCDHGKWRIPGKEEGGTIIDMAEHYISGREGRQVSADELSKLDIEFTPDKPEDTGGHGVPGRVDIDYDLKG